MTMDVFTGSGQLVQLTVIDVLNALFTSIPVADNIGNPLTVSIRAENSEGDPAEEQILVGVDEGPMEMFDNGQYVSFDTTTNMWKHFAWYPDTRIRFTVDSSKDQLRRFIISYIRWGILTAYSTDQYGNRIEGYLMNYMSANGIHRRRNKYLFDKPNYDPTNLAGPRPQGQVWSATLDMWMNVESVWFTPPAGTPAGILNLNTQNAQGIPNTVPLQPIHITTP